MMISTICSRNSGDGVDRWCRGVSIFVPGFVTLITLLAILASVDTAHAHVEDHSEHHRTPHDTATIDHQSLDVDELIYAAVAAQARHDFVSALDLTRAALDRRSDNDQALLLLASIHLVRGEADEAAAACRQLVSLHALSILTCHARVALARNDFDAINRKLESLLAVSAQLHLSAAELAWSFSVAGDLAVASHEQEKALRYLTDSLTLVDNSQVRATLVDVLIENREFDRATEVLAEGEQSLALRVRRLLVGLRQETVNDDGIARLDQMFQAWIAEDNWQHAREMSRFYFDVLDRPELAFRLAKINIKLQREPEDFRLLAKTAF